MSQEIQNILVTGGSGFIGQHLLRLLSKRGFNIRSIDLKSAPHELNEVEYIIGDIRNESSVKDHVNWSDAIIHLAAIASVPLCAEDPADSYSTNVFGTTLLLDLCKEKMNQTGKRTRVLFASSSAVYGEISQKEPLLETIDLPRSPSIYASQKKAAEEALTLYYSHYGIDTLSLRLFNVFGRGQNLDSPYSGVITRFFSSFENMHSIQIYGDGGQTRDFVSVEDVARAFYMGLLVNRTQLQGQVINIASGRSTSVRDLVDIIGQMYTSQPEIDYFPARIGDIRHSVADISKSQKLLNWLPRFSLEEGLSRMSLIEKSPEGLAEVINAFG